MSVQDNQSNRVESFALTVVFSLFSLTALLLLPFQTHSGPDTSGWWTQPIFMPAIALAVLCVANGLSLFKDIVALRANPATHEEKGESLAAIAGWFRPVEFFAYFIGYIFILGRVGYFLATLLFIQFLLFRVGLRGVRWMLAGLGAALVMTMIFRWGLGIWVPTADLYGLFPTEARKFLTKWF